MIGSVAFPAFHAEPDAWTLIGLVALLWLRSVRVEKARRAVPGAGGGSGARVVTRGQAACFAGAVATLLAASSWPIHDVAEGYLYSVHMFQHLLLTLVAGMLLVAGTPGWMARRLLGTGRRLRVVRSLSGMVPALIVFNLVLVLSHWPVIVEATVRFHPLHFVAHAVLLASAVIMWLPILSPLPEVPRLRPPVQMLYLFLQTIVPTIPASFLTFGTEPLYRIYAEMPRLWGISATTDQQTAGLIMKILGGMYLWGVIVVVFLRWFSSDEAAGRSAGGTGSGPGSDDPDRRPGDDPGRRLGEGEVLYWEDVEHELTRSTD